jgi:O-antigen/teichoic acid export membrane protein
LLAPEAFGIVAISASIQITIGLLSDIGLSQAVIQSRRGGDPVFLNTAWTVQILRGWLIWLACLSAAGLLWTLNTRGYFASNSVYAAPILPSVIAATSFIAVISGHATMKAISHHRNLDMKVLTSIEIVSMLVGLTFSTVVGYLTHSIWSIVIGALLASVTTTLLGHIFLPGRSDRLGWNREALSDLHNFGKWAFLSSSATALSMNGDRLLLGLWVTPSVLGNYSLASNLAMMVDVIGDRLFSSLSFPALSETARNSPERFNSVYFRMRWAADAGFVWMAGFLFTTADSIVSVMYDTRYASAGQMLCVLSFGLLFNRYNIVGAAYLALGKPKYTAAVNYTKLMSLFTLVPFLYYLYGDMGAIMGIAFYKAPTLILIAWLNRPLRLNSWSLEIAAVAFWAVGYLSGYIVLSIVGHWTRSPLL